MTIKFRKEDCAIVIGIKPMYNFRCSLLFAFSLLASKQTVSLLLSQFFVRNLEFVAQFVHLPLIVGRIIGIGIVQ